MPLSSSYREKKFKVILFLIKPKIFFFPSVIKKSQFMVTVTSGVPIVMDVTPDG